MSEHKHIIRITHMIEVETWDCQCGEGGIGPTRIVRTQILQHRMAAFPKVRERMLA